jgi:hypothetical protein
MQPDELGVEMTGDESEARAQLEDGLEWLADAPLFIDREQVEAFYDAIARPETKSGGVQATRTIVNKLHAKVSAGAEATAKFPRLIKLFPFLDAEAKVSIGAEGEVEQDDEKVEKSEYLPIDTPQRQLVQLALHYFTNWPTRMALASGVPAAGAEWLRPDFALATPRAMVFIDFPAHTSFIPVAAEVANGKVEMIFPRLQKAYSKAGDTLPPDYPGTHADLTEADDTSQQCAYWDWFGERMKRKPNLATIAVEETIAAGGGRVQWIDYRVPLGGGIKPLHLHISGRGAYDTGVFAYNLVQRGFKHGVRVVGTLKSEPDVNVLAIFEK